MNEQPKQPAFSSPERQKLFELLLKEKKQRAASGRSIPPSATTAGPHPVSFGQQRLWFLDQWEPGNPAYNLLQALRLRGQLHIQALRQSLDAIVERHAILRTTIVMHDGQPMQLIQPAQPLELPIVDLRHLQPSEHEQAIRQHAVTFVRQPFTLAQSPLIRALLLQLADDEYTLLLVMHHIVSDGWSNGVLFQDMALFYAAFSQNKTAQLPPLPIQYADFAIWQRQWLQGDTLQIQLAYWTNQMAGAPPVLELPTDYPRPTRTTYEGARHYLALPPQLTEALKAVSQQEGVSLFMVLLTAFKVLLYRYTGQHDIVVGSPISNRNRPEIEPLIGFFVNMLALRSSLADHLSFRELLHRVRDVTLTAYDHQDLPFERLVEELQLERDLSHTPLFQVMFVLQNTPLPTVQLPGATLSLAEIDSGTAQFDLTLELYEGIKGLQGSFQYNTDLFSAESIARMHSHFETLLAAIVAQPDQPIAQLPILAADERSRIVLGWNQTEATYPQDLGLHGLVAAQAGRTPEATAIQFADDTLTYAELDRRANQLAHYLRRLGIDSAVPVGVCLERSFDLVISLLAILKVGAAYMPLDPSYPVERLTFMVDDAGLSVVLTHETLSELLPQESRQLVYVDRIAADLAEQPSTPPAVTVDPKQMAYVIYTSGSTGRPKGVIVSHGAVVNFLHSMQQEPGLTAQDTLVAVTTLSFDIAVLELFLPLSVGARVVLARREETVDGTALAALLAATGATVMQATPATWRMLLETGWSPPAGFTLLCGGEALPLDLAQRLSAHDATLWNMYGPTETTIWSAVERIHPEPTRITIGRPIANTQIYLLDHQLQPVPIGIPGRLYIGGDGLAWGYLHRPELTAERFVPDPFSQTTGVRLYWTGDLARYLADGRIEHLGRIDHQVKLRGFRIELEEIEAALRQHETVQQVVVLLRELSPGDQRLVAYLVPEPGQALTVAELRADLQRQLPDYMVPSAYVLLEALPQTPNGKLNRSALPVPDSATEIVPGFVGPRHAVEDVLVGIWTSILDLNRISIYDNFFELGGHSLLATHVISRVNHTFAIELPIRAIFEAPTVAALAKHVQKARLNQEGIELPPITPVPRGAGLPLSFAQKRLWFVDQLTPGNPAYNVPPAMYISGPLKLEILQQGLDLMVQRHEAFRTSFTVVDDQPVQVISAPQSIPINVVDLRHLPVEEREPEARRLAGAEAARSFDLTRPPLLRVHLFQLDDQEYIVMMLTHHIIYDPMSGMAFVREMRQIYEALLANQQPSLPDLPLQYSDFAHWQRQNFQGAVLEKQLSYWKNRLAGAAPFLDLPTNRPRPPIQTFSGASFPLFLNAEVTEGLKALSHREGVTMYMVLLTMFKTLLYRYTGQEDLTVGSPIANRNRYEIENLIGFFVNSLVLRTSLENNPTFRELLGRVRETALGAYAHQDLPLDLLVDHLRPPRDPSRNPVFQVMFGYLHNYMVPVESLADLRLQLTRISREAAQFDLSLDFWEMQDGIHGAFEYNTDLFDRTTIARMVEHVQTVLRGILRDPEQRISDLPLVPEAEWQQLETWSRESRVEREPTTIQALFEAQVARTPDAAALIDGAQKLTYTELNRRANQLARHLVACGVGPNVLVGLCLPRSLDLLVGVLGILKAGGAYVPLDPTYPPERLAVMLQDSQATALVTQQALLPRLPSSPLRCVALDRDWPTIAQADDDNLDPRGMTDSLAYIIYTSGTTGTPKGVMVPQRALVNFTCAAHAAYALQPGDRVLQFASISFDASAEEIYPCLTSGATLVLRDDNMLSSPVAFLRQCRDWQISVLDLPSAYWHDLAANAADIAALLPSTLRLVIIGGERARPERVSAWLEHAPQVRLVNTYGPTETTVVATAVELTPDIELLPEVPIGRPVANLSAYILDHQLQPVPLGVTGMLYVGGAGLAHGYLRQPALTADTFMPDPFSTEPGARLYVTGDLVRYRPDGQIEYVGRADDQVKIRGFRIELGEVAATLMSYPAVQEAIVLVRDDDPAGAAGTKQLVAYLTPSQTPAPETSDLRRYMREKLPQYMVPTYFVVLESFPKSTGGKINPRALPAPERQQLADEATYIAPRTELERKIVAEWQAVLQVKKIGIHDNFFDLGGNSLLLAQLHSTLREIVPQELTLVELFEYPTIHLLTKHLSRSNNSASTIEPQGSATKIQAGKNRLQRQLQQRRTVTQSNPGDLLGGSPAALADQPAQIPPVAEVSDE